MNTQVKCDKNKSNKLPDCHLIVHIRVIGLKGAGKKLADALKREFQNKLTQLPPVSL